MWLLAVALKGFASNRAEAAKAARPRRYRLLGIGFVQEKDGVSPPSRRAKCGAPFDSFFGREYLSP
jgi:hypothetical protein